MSLVLAAISGALFGAGLLISGMTQPARVIGFLDITGRWDPSLAFVMSGAIGVYAFAYRAVLARRVDPWFDNAFDVPKRRDVDRRLLVGAAIFGVGWGLVGLCPGPAIVSSPSSTSALLFVAMMLIGMFVVRIASMRLRSRSHWSQNSAEVDS
ncbi:MAG: YeeE/YedE family protein [Deltaproteobacteria bacterium]|nr:YeeE/YedE family protein [Deltaproteobacteria bacterium]MDQ3297223.1 YeeE/YedE family protein [Myxococcota bacterium]